MVAAAAYYTESTDGFDVFKLCSLIFFCCFFFNFTFYFGMKIVHVIINTRAQLLNSIIFVEYVTIFFSYFSYTE